MTAAVENASVTSRNLVADSAKESAKRDAATRDAINLDVADNEAALTNRVASPSTADPKGRDKSLATLTEGFDTPISSRPGSLPMPPNEEDVKEHDLSGYRATALQGRNPNETAEAYVTRREQEEDDFAEQQKDAATATKKLTGDRQKQDTLAAKQDTANAKK